MSDFFEFTKIIEKQKFINFLIEKCINPSDLLTFATKLKKSEQVFEERYRRFSGSSKSGFLSALGGGFRGLYHGFRAGMGTSSIKKATDILKSQLDLAYEKFLDTLTDLTGNEIAAVRIVTFLRQNADKDIDARIYGIGSPLVQPIPTKKDKTVEPDEDSDGTEDTESSKPETPKPETPKPSEPIKDPKKPSDSTEDKPVEPDDSGEDFTPVDADQTEIDLYERTFKDAISDESISSIVDTINREYGDGNELSTKGLIQLMNRHSDDNELINKCFEIIKSIKSLYDEMNKKELGEKFVNFAISLMSTDVQSKINPKSEIEGLGTKISMTPEKVLKSITEGDVLKYLIDITKLEEDDNLQFFSNTEIYKIIDPSGDKVISKIQNRAIDDPTVFMYIIIDSSNNYVEIKENDLKRIRQEIFRRVNSSGST